MRRAWSPQPLLAAHLRASLGECRWEVAPGTLAEEEVGWQGRGSAPPLPGSFLDSLVDGAAHLHSLQAEAGESGQSMEQEGLEGQRPQPSDPQERTASRSSC